MAALVACGDSDDGDGPFTTGGPVEDGTDPPGSQVLEATLIDLVDRPDWTNENLEAQGGSGGVIDDRPIDPEVTFGLSGESTPEAEGRVDTRQFVAVIADAGCTAVESAELRREGDNLGVRFIGEDHDECYAHSSPYVQFEVPGDQLEGIETIELQPPLDPTGPGELVDLIRMGSGREVGEVTTRAAELPSPETESLAEDLVVVEAQAALEYEPPEGMTGFAFVLSGCQEDGAELVLTEDEISAVLTTSDPEEIVSCAEAVEFLAIFQIPDEALPEGAELDP